MLSASLSLPTWPDTKTKPPAFVASERGSARVPGLLSSKNSIVTFGTFLEGRLIDPVRPAWGLTFDMSGDRRQAKLAVGRPLDGGVRRRHIERPCDFYLRFTRQS